MLNLFHSCACSFTAGDESHCKLSKQSVGAHTCFLNVNYLQFLMIPSCPLIMNSQFHCPCMCCLPSNAWIIVLAREVSSTRALFWVTTGKSWITRLLPGVSGHQWVCGKGSSFAAGQWATVLKATLLQLSWTTLSINWLNLDMLRRRYQAEFGSTRNSWSDPVKYKRERDRNG